MRIAMNNAREGKKGVFLPKHNSRNFKGGPHIDRERSQNNIYWSWNNNPNFEESECAFYENHFRDYVENRNARYRKNGNKAKIKDLESYRKNKRSCPEEVIFSIGNKDSTVDPTVLHEVFKEFQEWHNDEFTDYEKGNCIYPLNYAVHQDEEGAPHIHLRRVYMSTDKHGDCIVNQTKCLEGLGIERPDVTKRKDRYNNPKITYTKMCRDKFTEIAKAKGLGIETKPRDRSKSGRDLNDYISDQKKEEVNKLKREIAELEQSKTTLRSEFLNQSKQNKALRLENNTLKREIEGNKGIINNQKTTINSYNASISDLRSEKKSLEQNYSEVKSNVSKAKLELQNVNVLKDEEMKKVKDEGNEILDNVFRKFKAKSKQGIVEKVSKTVKIPEEEYNDILEIQKNIELQLLSVTREYEKLDNIKRGIEQERSRLKLDVGNNQRKYASWQRAYKQATALLLDEFKNDENGRKKYCNEGANIRLRNKFEKEYTNLYTHKKEEEDEFEL